MLAVEAKTETAERCVYGDDCPLHTGTPSFNAKTLAAIKEGDAIFRHEIPAK